MLVLVVAELTTVTVLPMLVWEVVEGVRVWEASDDEGGIIFPRRRSWFLCILYTRGACDSDANKGAERSVGPQKGHLRSNFYCE